MKAEIQLLLIVVPAMLTAACTAPPAESLTPRADEDRATVYLVNHGWHAGFVIKRSDLPADVWPQQREFAEAEYLEVGWGDRDYYMSRRPHVGILLKAALWPTESVLHVVGMQGPVSGQFPRSEVWRIEFSTAGMRRLGRYVERSYALDEQGRSRPLGPSLYGRGRFYLSRESYHLFNTCNAWTARAMRAAGCPLIPATKLRVDALLSSLAECGAVLHSAPAMANRGSALGNAAAKATAATFRGPDRARRSARE